MKNIFRRIIKGEAGQALPVVLMCLVVGSLMVAPSLDYVSTSLSSTKAVSTSIGGIYAAEAGIEDALWSISGNQTPRTSLPLALNGMDVAVATVDEGYYNLLAGEWVAGGDSHNDWLDVSTDIVWDGGAGYYKYTITVIWQPDTSANVKLSEVGAYLPVGYSYLAGSAASFGENLSTDEPDDELDGHGAYLLEWEFPPPRPLLDEINNTATQIFYIDGSGDLDGAYAWVIAQRQDVGTVGEIEGNLYVITATAEQSGTGQTTAVIEATVMQSEGTLYIVSWQIKPRQ